MEEKQSETTAQSEILSFGKDTLTYSVGNGLILLFGFIQLFIIPKYLSVEDYGYWQLFMLYGTYFGVLHLGFLDGILVRWAGKKLTQVGNEIRTASAFIVLEQIVIIVPISLLVYFLAHPPLQWIWLMILASAFIMNLTWLFVFTAQAVRKFRLLTAVNVGRALALLILVILFFALGFRSYHFVIIAFLTSYLLALFTFVFWFRKYLWCGMSFQSSQAQSKAIPVWANFYGQVKLGKETKMPVASLLVYGKENISIGFFVLLGNLSGVIFLTIDRLMVSSFFPIDQFAIYALAATIIAVVYTFVIAASNVIFPYISAVAPQLRSRAFHLGKAAIIILWAAMLVIYFPIARLIEFYLPQYVASLPLVHIIIGSVGFGSLIQILHVNYYKVYRMQRQYFLWGLAALALSVLLSLLAIKVWGTLESVAIAVFISFVVWYIVNELSLRPVVEENSREPWRSVAILLCYISAFWLVSLLVSWFVFQMIAYICLFSAITWLFLRREAKELVITVNKVRDQPR